MKIKPYIIVSVIFLLSFSACGTKTINSESSNSHTDFDATNIPNATAIPLPESGKSTVTGKVVSTTGENLSTTPVWLAEVVRQGDRGAYVLDSVSSPGIYSDNNGLFVISDITPGEYVIVVGDPEGQYKIIAESSGEAKVWDFPPDEVYDVGILQVQLIQ